MDEGTRTARGAPAAKPRATSPGRGRSEGVRRPHATPDRGVRSGKIRRDAPPLGRPGPPATTRREEIHQFIHDTACIRNPSVTPGHFRPVGPPSLGFFHEQSSIFRPLRSLPDMNASNQDRIDEPTFLGASGGVSGRKTLKSGHPAAQGGRRRPLLGGPPAPSTHRIMPTSSRELFFIRNVARAASKGPRPGPAEPSSRRRGRRRPRARARSRSGRGASARRAGR